MRNGLGPAVLLWMKCPAGSLFLIILIDCRRVFWQPSGAREIRRLLRKVSHSATTVPVFAKLYQSANCIFGHSIGFRQWLPTQKSPSRLNERNIYNSLAFISKHIYWHKSVLYYAIGSTKIFISVKLIQLLQNNKHTISNMQISWFLL